MSVEALADMVHANTEMLKDIFAKTNAIYLTMLETEHATRMVSYYEMLKKQIAEAEGGNLLNNVMNDVPGE